MAILIFRRLLVLPFLMLAISFFLFVLIEFIPADPARLLVGPDADSEMLKAARERLALDRPVIVRFAAYMKNLTRGDLGISIATKQPVLRDLLRYLPATFELTLSSVLLAVMVGLPIGMYSAVRRKSTGDKIARFFSFASASFPVFWSGLLLQLVFYGRLQILPFGGRISGDAPPTLTGFFTIDSLLCGELGLFFTTLKSLVLPSITLSFITFAVVVRISRAALLDVLGEPYIQVARAKGLSQTAVIFKHALRNAAIPIITAVSVRFGYLLGGAVITESIFAWPGIGNYAVTAIKSMDYPVILGFTLMSGVLFIMINLLTDILCAMVDPRIRY